LNQLGFVDFIYPDGRHSRLSHSLEAFEIAREVACQLLDDTDFRLHINSEDINLFLCAALLHDIGHYPLTHVIEDLPETKEDWQVADHFLNLKLDSWEQSNLTKLVRDDWGLDTVQIVRLIGKLAKHKLTPTEQIFRSLLNSALDVDKMAYLTQDSRFTGVSYGSGIAVDLLVSSMTVVRNPENSLLEIGITDKGISAAESLITARYHMYSRVYWHHTNRAVMAMVKYVMQNLFRHRAKKSYSFSDFLEETLPLSEMETLRLMSQKFEDVTHAQSLGNPLKGIIDGSRTLYKRLASFSSDAGGKRTDIHRKLIGLPQKELEKIRKSCLKELQVITGKKWKDSYVLIDAPKISKENDAIPDCYVKDQFTGKPRLLESQSAICRAVYNDFGQRVKKSRIFIHPEIRSELHDEKLKNALAAIENIILD
jgi:HD superfamily phosphohydrolase